MFERGWLRSDFIAGLTVMALLVPEGMAYAELAGMPPQTIFYAAPAALLLYAIFGTSRQLVVVVSSVQAVMSYSIISALVPPGTSEFIVLSSALAITAGFVSVLAGALHLRQTKEGPTHHRVRHGRAHHVGWHGRARKSRRRSDR